MISSYIDGSGKRRTNKRSVVKSSAKSVRNSVRNSAKSVRNSVRNSAKKSAKKSAKGKGTDIMISNQGTNAIVKIEDIPKEPSYNIGREFWVSLRDHDFFGDKVQHIYMYSIVNDASVMKLRQDIVDACKRKQSGVGVWVHPKPIVVHVHSPGGSGYSMQLLISMYSLVNVPICSMVDGYSESAATAISIFAPYRVAASPFSWTLIHDYAVGIEGKREYFLEKIQSVENVRDFYKKLYLKHMKIDEKTLESVLRRDLLWDVDTCMKYGVYDRVLFYNDKKKKLLQLDPGHPLLKQTRPQPLFGSAPFQKSNWNYVSVTCDVECPKRLDEILSQGTVSELQPIVLRSPSILGSQTQVADAVECVDHYISYAIIPRILACQVPVYGIIDNVVDWWKFLPVFFCTHRYMYENTSIYSFLGYRKEFGVRLSDINENTIVMRTSLVNALTNNVACATTSGSTTNERTLLSPKGSKHVLTDVLDNMFDQFQTFSPNKCLAMGIVDEIVNIL